MFGGVNTSMMSQREMFALQSILADIDRLESSLVAGDISTLLCEQGGEILATQDGTEIMAHRVLAI